jgi:hypothetical protein
VNIDQLKRGLDEIASDLDDPAVVIRDRVHAVDTKVVKARRGRIVVVATVALAVAAVGVAAPSLTGRGAAPPASNGEPPPGVVSTALPTVTDNGVVFYRDGGGSDLVAEAASTPGDQSLTLQVTPETLSLAWVGVCWTDDGHSTAHFRLLINGVVQTWGRCNEQPYGPLQATAWPNGGSPASVATHWTSMFGGTVGSPVSVRMEVTGVDPAQAPPQLAFGLFTYPEQFHEQGVWHRKYVVDNGVEYQEIGSQTRRFTKAPASMRVSLDIGGESSWVEAGTVGLTGPGRFSLGSRLVQNATGSGSNASAGALFDQGQTQAVVRFVSPRRDISGRLWAAVYRPVR